VIVVFVERKIDELVQNDVIAQRYNEYGKLIFNDIRYHA